MFFIRRDIVLKESENNPFKPKKDLYKGMKCLYITIKYPKPLDAVSPSLVSTPASLFMV